MNKKIRHTDHLLEQIRKRKINLDLIEQTINKPQQRILDKDDFRREICQSILIDTVGRQKIIRVVIEETKNEIIVVTAYVSSNVSKYWSKDEN